MDVFLYDQYRGNLYDRNLASYIEHILGMLAAGDSQDLILSGYPWMEKEDIQACMAYAHRMVGHERVEPVMLVSAS